MIEESDESISRFFELLEERLSHDWPIQRQIAPQHIPILLRTLLESLTIVRSIEDEGSYLRSFLEAIVQTARRRQLVFPNDVLHSPIALVCRDTKFILRPGVTFGYYLLPFERAFAEAMLSRKGRLFVDIGANIGQYTIPMAARFERVVAVEPNPFALEILSENLRLNRIGNVTIVPRAISPSAGAVRLYPGDFLSTLSVLPSARPSIECESITMENLLDGLDEVDVMKVDIESAEEAAMMPFLDRLGAVHEIFLETLSRPLLRGLFEVGFRCEVMGTRWKPFEGVRAYRSEDCSGHYDL